MKQEKPSRNSKVREGRKEGKRRVALRSYSREFGVSVAQEHNTVAVHDSVMCVCQVRRTNKPRHKHTHDHNHKQAKSFKKNQHNPSENLVLFCLFMLLLLVPHSKVHTHTHTLKTHKMTK
ncbi:hypothetical protein AAHE18_09G184200 [Arachis hypogaea]